MKRLALLLPVGLVLMAFTLADTSLQTARVRWDTFALSTSAKARSEDFSNGFNRNGLQGTGSGSNAFAQASWRMSNITCKFGAAGTTDGGANNVVAQVVHEDAGVDCSCSLGDCSSTSELGCDCGGYVELQGQTWHMQLAPTTACIANPGAIHCTVDLFR